MSFIEKLRSVIFITHNTTPTVPAAGTLKMYAKADNNFYVLNSAGVEVRLGIDQTGTLSGKHVSHDEYGDYIWTIDSIADHLPRLGKAGNRVALLTSGVDQIWEKPSDVELLYLIVVGGGQAGGNWYLSQPVGGGGGMIWSGFVKANKIKYTIGAGGLADWYGGTSGGDTSVALFRNNDLAAYPFSIISYGAPYLRPSSGAAGGACAQYLGITGYAEENLFDSMPFKVGRDGISTGFFQGGSTIFNQGGGGDDSEYNDDLVTYIPSGGASYGPGGKGKAISKGVDGVLGGGGGCGGYIYISQAFYMGGNGGDGCVVIFY